jgi:hypothetical protein
VVARLVRCLVGEQRARHPQPLDPQRIEQPVAERRLDRALVAQPPDDLAGQEIAEIVPSATPGLRSQHHDGALHL